MYFDDLYTIQQSETAWKWNFKNHFVGKFLKLKKLKMSKCYSQTRKVAKKASKHKIGRKLYLSKFCHANQMIQRPEKEPTK